MKEVVGDSFLVDFYMQHVRATGPGKCRLHILNTSLLWKTTLYVCPLGPLSLKSHCTWWIFMIEDLGCSFSVTSSIASLFTSNWHFSAELESFFWHSSHTRVISQNLSNQISILTKVEFHSNHQIPNHDLNSALWHLYDCKQRGDDGAYRKAAGQWRTIEHLKLRC